MACFIVSTDPSNVNFSNSHEKFHFPLIFFISQITP
uniref:Uncharacterized protein n=1 Tax=Arundo donax TaxID=35708 RepID=A0A0A9BRY6_ARUDO